MKPNSTAIVGGQFKGTRLRTGRDHRIRPTQARVREAMFSLLPDLSGADVLDLYAGVGTLGFEALSRGAKSVTFVERSKSAIRLLEANRLLFEKGTEKGTFTIIQKDCARFLQTSGPAFDVILADPPYGQVDLSDLKDSALGRLKTGGTLVMETAVRQAWTDGEANEKIYGDTRVLVIRNTT